MPKHILLIDDNPDDLEFYCDLLQNSQDQYIVHVATTTREALDIFATQQIFCTFIDYNLPGTNGIQILEALADLKANQVLPIVILTGEPSQTVQAEAARRGALNYIVKNTTNTTELLDSVILKTTQWAHELNQKNTKVH